MLPLGGPLSYEIIQKVRSDEALSTGLTGSIPPLAGLNRPPMLQILWH